MSPYYNAKLAFTRKCLRQCEKPGALPGIRFLWILLTAAAYRDLLKQVKKNDSMHLQQQCFIRMER
jgi:hypothetical protein